MKRYQELLKEPSSCITKDGDVEFSGERPKRAKYIVTKPTNPNEATDEELKKVYDTLVKYTSHAPTLIISVTGGAKNFTVEQQWIKVFRRGLMKVAETTGAWIISGGTNVGVMKHVGEAVAQHCSAKPTTKVVTLGIATLGVLSQSCKFGEEPQHFIKYGPCTNTNLTDLDKNHSHFVLVDTRKKGVYGGEIHFRAQLEKYIARSIETKLLDGDHKPEETDRRQKQALICCVLLQGGPGSLKTVCRALKEGTPVVVVAGSGQCANILAELDKSDKTIYTEEEVEQLLEGEKMDFKGKNTEWTEGINECVKYLKSDKPEEHNLMTIFELCGGDGAKDLDVAILESIIRAAPEGGTDTEKETRSKRQLRLAIEWNRVDIAKSHILVEGLEIPKKCLADEMLMLALVKNRPAFVQLLLEEVLDEVVLLSEDEILLPNRKTENDDKYLRSLLQNGETKMFKRNLAKLLGQHKHNWAKKLAAKCLCCIDIQAASAKPQAQEPSTNETKGVSISQLFQWAIVTNKRFMSRVLWNNMTYRLPAAVAAVAMLRKLRKKATAIDEKQELRDHGEDYKALALGILTKSYRENPKKTQELIRLKLPVWNDSDCLQIAVDNHFREFVSHPAVQDLADKMWSGEDDKSLPVDSSWQNSSSKPSSGRAGCEIRDVWNICRRTRVKFWLHFISYLLFLLLFTYILVFNFHPYNSDDVTSTLITGKAPSPWEWLLFGWVVLHWLNEGFQIWEITLQRWFRDYWNKADLVAFVLFALGFVLRFVDWDASRFVLSISFVVFCVRILHIFTVFERIGPMVSMVRKMINDHASFLFVIAVFLLAYGVANQALLYPNENRVDVAIIGIFYKPYWQLYGELFLDEIDYDPDSPDKFPCSNNATGNDQRCPEVHKMAPVLTAIYMLLANILLLNLLIALFSYTFSKRVEKNEKIWKFQRYKLVQKYHSKSLPPAPFNLPYFIYLFVSRCREGKEKINEEVHVTEDFSQFDDWCTDAYLHEKESNLELIERLENIETAMKNLTEPVEKILNKLNHIQISIQGQQAL